MPLLMVTGYPSSGKTYWATKLLQSFQELIAASSDTHVAKLSCVLINDESLGIDKMAYADARQEKAARGLLFSAVERHLGKECLVICDALNYIKGFRYQLSCSAKALGTPHCLVHVGCPVQQCEKFNHGRSDGYSGQVLDELVMRYEEPNVMSRWDSPCFNVFYEDLEAPVTQIWDSLVNRKIARPNASTLMKPAVEGDYLYELDKVTQAVVALVLDTQKMGVIGGDIKVDGLLLSLPDQAIGLAALQRLRRQFIGLNKSLMVGGPTRLKTLFVEFLNDQWQ